MSIYDYSLLLSSVIAGHRRDRVEPGQGHAEHVGGFGPGHEVGELRPGEVFLEEKGNGGCRLMRHGAVRRLGLPDV